MYSSKLLLGAVNECRRVTSEALARSTSRYIVGMHGRYISTTHTRATNTDKRDDNCSRKWDYQVTQFGRLIVNTSDHLDVRIESLCPDEYPHMDRFVMDVCQPGGVTASLLERIQCQQQCCQQDDNIVVTVADVSGNDRCSTAECHIQIPVKFDVAVHVTGDKSVSLQTTENSYIDISVALGHCMLHNIKTSNLRLSSGGGDITSKTLLQGNTVIQTHGQGNVTIDKPLGQVLHIETEAGDINVTSLYVEATEFVTKRGSINIGSCHGDARVEIQEKGNCSIGTVDGSLQTVVQEGNIDVHIARHKHVTLTTNKGDIRIGLSEGTSTDVSLEARDVSLDEKLNTAALRTQTKDGQTLITGDLSTHGSMDDSCDQSSLNAQAKFGAISLQLQNWLDALKHSGSFHKE